MNGKTVYTLTAAYKDNDPENLGVYGSPRALAVGIAKTVFKEAKEDGGLEYAVKAAALAVYDLMTLSGFQSDRDECRYGQTVYGCESNEVEEEEEDEDA